MTTFRKVTLYTDPTGRSRFKEDVLLLSEGTPQIRKSPPATCKTYRLRHSPIGFDYDFHCTNSPMWVVILEGRMEITLQDGTSRLFSPGDCFFAENSLPHGATFNPEVHGHKSCQVGAEPLVTMHIDI